MNKHGAFAVPPPSSTEERHLAPGLTEEAQFAERVFVRGEGTRIFDEVGRSYLDFGAGILTQAVGHCHPHVTQRVQAQVGQLTNIHDSATSARGELCGLLAELFPEHLNSFAFFSTGAEAVEAAIRAVHAQARPGKTVIAALKSGFHGKTKGARALVNWTVGSEPKTEEARQFPHAHCFNCPLNLTYPDCGIACARHVADEIRASDDLAALVFEPVQAAGGVIVPPRDYWKIIEQACREKGVVMVADEIVTAGGRTGPFLASEYYGIEPDLVTAAKGLSSGLPFSMLAGRDKIMSAPGFASPGSTSSTYGGNPVSCVAATSTLEVLRDDDVLSGVSRLGDQLRCGLRELHRSFPDQIADVRGIGLLHAIEFGAFGETRREQADRATHFYQSALDQGVRVGLGGNIARLAPPLNVSQSEIEDALGAFRSVLSEGAAS
ncbi:MAG: aspartate aminotransferase family protein [Pseudomonadota bacterium]